MKHMFKRKQLASYLFVANLYGQCLALGPRPAIKIQYVSALRTFFPAPFPTTLALGSQLNLQRPPRLRKTANFLNKTRGALPALGFLP